MADIKKSVPEQAQQNPKKTSALPYLILGLIVSLLMLNYFGVIDLTKFKSAFMTSKTLAPGECPKISCDLTKDCCGVSTYDAALGTNRAVFAVLTYAKCDCPLDTEPTPIGEDTQAAGGPYKICKCKGVEE